MNTANGNFEITENLDSLTYGFLGLNKSVLCVATII